MKLLRWSALIVLGSVCVLVSKSEALCTAAVSLTIDPSSRSHGMGGASSAVFWGGDPNDWANPALLGYRRGIRFGYSKYQLVPELASDVFFNSTRITFGGWGVGLSFAGQPNLLGGSRLNYGISEQIDAEGNLVGIFDSYETIESFGIGINVVELMESVLGLAGSTAHIGRWGDVSLGWSRKRVLVDLAPADVIAFPMEPIPAETNDLGLLLRARPIDTVTQEGPGPSLTRLGGLRLDAVFAMSSLNHEDEEVQFELGISSPIGRDKRWGFAVHAETGFPPAWGNSSKGATWAGSAMASPRFWRVE